MIAWGRCFRRQNTIDMLSDTRPFCLEAGLPWLIQKVLPPLSPSAGITGMRHPGPPERAIFQISTSGRRPSAPTAKNKLFQDHQVSKPRPQIWAPQSLKSFRVTTSYGLSTTFWKGLSETARGCGVPGCGAPGCGSSALAPRKAETGREPRRADLARPGSSAAGRVRAADRDRGRALRQPRCHPRA